MIIDCDVLQSTGTAFIFKEEEEEVFTFSMNGAKNYPLHKEASDLDIELNDGTEDTEFLSILDQALQRIIQHDPEMIYYPGGTDPLKKTSSVD